MHGSVSGNRDRPARAACGVRGSFRAGVTGGGGSIDGISVGRTASRYDSISKRDRIRTHARHRECSRSEAGTPAVQCCPSTLARSSALRSAQRCRRQRSQRARTRARTHLRESMRTANGRHHWRNSGARLLQHRQWQVSGGDHAVSRRARTARGTDIEGFPHARHAHQRALTPIDNPIRNSDAGSAPRNSCARSEDDLMRHTPFALAVVVATAGGITAASAADLMTNHSTPRDTPNFSVPVSGLTAFQLERFTEGKEAFEETEVPADGLGPGLQRHLVRPVSHARRNRRGERARRDPLRHLHARGAFEPMGYIGGSLIQTDGIGVAGSCDYVGELVPPDATIVAGRRTTSLFGLGLVDAVPDIAFVALAVATRYSARRPGSRTWSTSVGGTAARRQVRMEEPGRLAARFLGRRLPERDGHHDAALPRGELPAGRLRHPRMRPLPGVDDDLEDVELFRDFMQLLGPTAASAAGPHRVRSPTAAAYSTRRMLRLPRPDAGDRTEPGTRARLSVVRALFGLSPPRHGRARRRHRPERSVGPRDADGAALGRPAPAGAHARRPRSFSRGGHSRPRRPGAAIAPALRRPFRSSTDVPARVPGDALSLRRRWAGGDDG